MLPRGYEVQDFTLVDLLLKLASPESILFNIQIEKLLRIIFSMVININYHHFVSSLPYAKHKYICIFPLYSNSLVDLLMLVYLVIEACMKLKSIKRSEDIAY